MAVLSALIASALKTYIKLKLATSTFRACCKVGLVFFALVTVRLTVPRLKLEVLSKSGWVAGFGILLFSIAVYLPAWLYI
jgi:NADH:ubiquinone oxidoreductase subunit H